MGASPASRIASSSEPTNGRPECRWRPRRLALAAETSKNAWDMTASDLAAGSKLLQTGLDGALANVAINLPELHGEAATRIERAYRELLAKT